MLFFKYTAIYFFMMSKNYKKCGVRVLGVALEGLRGMPVIVFDSPENGEFFSVSVSPFDAEILIGDYAGEAESSASSWLAALLESSPPLRGIVHLDKNGNPLVRLEFGVLRKGFSRDRSLSIGEGLSIVRRLALPLYAEESLFADSGEELSFLNSRETFGRDFLYLAPLQFASNIPTE